jgi:flagellar hook-length control protein FliK
MTLPEFGAALGVKVRDWATDGIQNAWLEVHPADMGPVAIRIQVDGQQAQLDFGAASAAARQVLENSLPDLAAALQGAGLTLSGGGVYEQLARRESSAQDDASSDDGSGRRIRGGEGARAEQERLTAAGGSGLRAVRPQGLVDTYV